MDEIASFGGCSNRDGDNTAGTTSRLKRTTAMPKAVPYAEPITKPAPEVRVPRPSCKLAMQCVKMTHETPKRLVANRPATSLRMNADFDHAGQSIAKKRAALNGIRETSNTHLADTASFLTVASARSSGDAKAESLVENEVKVPSTDKQAHPFGASEAESLRRIVILQFSVG